MRPFLSTLLIGILFLTSTKGQEANSFLLKTSEAYKSGDLKVGDSLLEIGLLTCVEGDEKIKALFYKWKGIRYADMRIHDSSNFYLNLSKRESINMGDSSSALNIEILKAGYLSLINLNMALNLYQKLLNQSIQEGDTLNYYNILAQMASCYSSINESERVKKICFELINYYKKENDSLDLCRTYFALAQAYKENRDYDSLFYFLELSDQYIIKDNPHLKIRNMQLSALSIIDQNPEQALIDFQEIERICQKFGIQADNIDHNFGEIYLKLGKYSLAISRTLKAYNSAVRQNNHYLRYYASAQLYEGYKQINQLDSALFYLEDYMSYKDSVSQKTNLIKSGELAASAKYEKKIFEKELKDQKDKLLNEERIEKLKIIQKGILTAIVLLSVIMFLVIRGYHKKKRTNRIMEQKNHELNRLNKLNKKIFSIISHDLNGPMLSLRLFIEALIGKDTSIDILQFYLQDLKSQLYQTEGVFANLLNWAKTELTPEYNLKVLNLRSDVILDDVSMEFMTQCSAKKITIINKVPKNTELNIDPNILKIIFRNLIANAIKYSERGQSVECGYFSDHKIFYVKDSGIGISKDKLDVLFKDVVNPSFGTFYEKGYGIGLFICAELVHKCDGEIWAEDQPEGATIYFSFNKSA